MSLYKELNDVKLDLSEFEEIQLSTGQQKRITNIAHNKVHSNSGITRKMRRNRFAVAAAFCVASVITLNMAFPALAEKLPNISSIFSLFSDNARYVFDDYEEHSTAIGLTKESNGIQITVTDAVYDKENITIAYTIKSEQDLGDRPVFEGEMVVDEFQNRPKYTGFAEQYLVEKISDHEYAVLYIYELIRGAKPEEVHVSWQGDKVINLNNVRQVYDGDWSFGFSLNALENKQQRFDDVDVMAEDEGVEVNVIKMTETPVATTIYLTEKVDERLVAQKDEGVALVQIEYKVSDNLGNDYNYIHFRDTGHSSEFVEAHRSAPRITLNRVDNDVTHLEITPIITVIQVENGKKYGSLETVGEPYSIEPIQVPLKK